MNRNFRVKVNRLLVGYSGLCKLIGKRYANHLITKALRSNAQVIVFKNKFGYIKFYSK